MATQADTISTVLAAWTSWRLVNAYFSHGTPSQPCMSLHFHLIIFKLIPHAREHEVSTIHIHRARLVQAWPTTASHPHFHIWVNKKIGQVTAQITMLLVQWNAYRLTSVLRMYSVALPLAYEVCTTPAHTTHTSMSGIPAHPN